MGRATGSILFVLSGAVAAAFSVFSPAAWCATGSTAAGFLKFTPSPRATGMGESQVSVSGDAYSSYWNPAGLAAVETPEIAATYNSSFEQVDTQYVAAAWPLEYGSTLGFGLTRLTVAPFQGYDAQGVKTRAIDSSDMSVGFSYGRALFKDEISRPVFSAGGAVKYISERLDNVSASAFAVDAGAIYYIRPSNYWMSNLPAQEFRVALAARNIGTGLKFDKGSFPLPAAVSLGGSWHSHPGGSGSLILSLDNVMQAGEGYYAALGAEYTAFQLLSMRAGYRTGQDIGSGIRAGVGFHLSFVDLDYSMSPFGDLGSMHKFGLSMKFGAAKAAQPLAGETSRAAKAKLIAPKQKIERLDLYAKDFLALAQKDIDARRYVSAMENLKKAFNLEPELRGGAWGAKEKRLGAIVAGLKLREIPVREKRFAPGPEQADVASEAVLAYMNGQDLKSLLLSQAAYGANIRGDAMFEELVYLVSDLVKIHVRRDEILPKGALIKEKLKKSARSFYIQQFDMAAKECEEVVLLDEANHMAWTRMGSAYYMMSDKERAKKAYLKAVEIKPDDLVTLEFLRKQGWQSDSQKP